MKKHLQFNDITALSLGWRAARRKAEKERRAEREKEQSSSSLLCIFIKETITSSPSCSLFLFSSFAFFLSHSFAFFPFSASLSSVHSPFFLHCLWLISFFSPLCPLFIYLGHSFLPYEKLFIPQCIFSPVLCCLCYSSQSTGLSEGLERFISKHYKSALGFCPGSPALLILVILPHSHRRL